MVGENTSETPQRRANSFWGFSGSVSGVAGVNGRKKRRHNQREGQRERTKKPKTQTEKGKGQAGRERTGQETEGRKRNGGSRSIRKQQPEKKEKKKKTTQTYTPFWNPLPPIESSMEVERVVPCYNLGL